MRKIALLVAGVKPDDEVLVSDLTFIAPANAIRYANAWPVLIDAEPVYWQMDVTRAIDLVGRRARHMPHAQPARRHGCANPSHLSLTAPLAR